MKHLPLICLLQVVFAASLAQDKTAAAQFVKSRVTRVNVSLLPRAKKKKTPPYYANIHVADFRPDTTRLGFWAENRSRRELVFEKNTSQFVENYLNAIHSDASGSQSFLIIIKKLWLYDEKSSTGRSSGRLAFRGEAFLKSDHGWMPYVYVDTTIYSKFSIKSSAGYEIAHAFDALINKIAATGEETIRSRNRFYSFQQLDSLNKMCFAYNMDTATALTKGVYVNVSEFRNNTPSILNYEITRDENGLPQLYIKDEAGNSHYSHKVFGYCDGKQSYAMMNGNIFPILSINHAFYVWGSKEFKLKTQSIPVMVPPFFGMVPLSENAVRMMRFFHLDPYSGEIY